MHQAIFGQSGTGKSTLLKDIIAAVDGGFCLLDPHGDLAEWVADHVECIYFEPTTIPIGLNVLHDIPRHERHLVAGNVVMALKAIWGDSWGPRMEWILYNAVRVELNANGSLLDIPRLLTDPDFRTKCLEHTRRLAAKNPSDTSLSVLLDFWRHEFDAWDSRQRNDYIQPVMNKLGRLTADPTISRILGAPRCLDMTRLLNRSRRLVVNLSKSRLGETPSHLLGALLVSHLFHAALRSERYPFTIIADEFQNFATDSFATILSEARKYGLSLCLATQFLDQLPETLQAAVLGNVQTVTSFRVAPKDAHILGPILDRDPSMLIDLENYRAWQNYRHPPDPKLISVAPPELEGGKLALNIHRTLDRHVRH